MEKIKININKGLEFSTDAFLSKQIIYQGVAYHQEVFDFRNSERLGEHFEALTSEAKKYLGKHFLARVRVDDFKIHYEFFEFLSGELLGSKTRIRGVVPVGEFEIFCFSLSGVNVKCRSTKVDWSDPHRVDIYNQIQDRVFFCPPKRTLFEGV